MTLTENRSPITRDPAVVPDAEYVVWYTDIPSFERVEVWRENASHFTVYVEDGLNLGDQTFVASKALLRLDYDIPRGRLSVRIAPELPWVEWLGEQTDDLGEIGTVIEAFYRFMFEKVAWTSSPLPSEDEDSVGITYAGLNFLRNVGVNPDLRAPVSLLATAARLPSA